MQELRDGKEKFRSSEILALLQRGPGVSDQNWGQLLLIASKSVKEDIMNPDNEDNLYLIDPDESNQGGWVVQMGNEHLEVFARATKTRIVLLHYWEDMKKGKQADATSNKFTSLVIDHRDGLGPHVVYSNEIPGFGITTSLGRLQS